MRKIKSVVPVCVFFLVLLCVAADKPKLTRVKVNDDLSVLVPKDWTAMDDLDITQRYPSVRAPLLAYTNYERVADFSINVSATQWPDDDVELAQQFFKSGVMNMFDRVEMIDEGIRNISGKKFIFFEFDSRVNGNRQKEELKDPILRYNHIQYLIQPGKALVFSFSCPRRMQEEWQTTAREMMQGIKVK
jgi:hypothetical protein